jgi:3-oxoacyl-(acyl-carrier-protein) synthase III
VSNVSEVDRVAKVEMDEAVTGIGITGVGSYVPEEVISNKMICDWTGTDEAWIARLTGIRERRWARADQASSDLAIEAAKPLLTDPDVRDRIRYLLAATNTPDHSSPPTAAIVQAGLGLNGIPAFDVGAACAGTLYSLALLEPLLRADAGAHALVVGSDKVSPILDRTDRRTVTLFGDGGGALLVGPVPDGYGILGHALWSDGAHHDKVGVTAGGSRQPFTEKTLVERSHLFHMSGRAVAAYAHDQLPLLVKRALDQAGMAGKDIDRFVCHQANARMVASLAAAVGVEPERVPLTVDRFGNTGAASIPVTLHASHLDRPLQRGENLLMAAIGAGLSLATVVVRWY